MSRATPAGPYLLPPCSSKRQDVDPFPWWPTGRPQFWVRIVHRPLKGRVPQADGPTFPGSSAHRAVRLPWKQGDLAFLCSPQSPPLVGKLRKVWIEGSWRPRCWRGGNVVRGPELCPPSPSRNITSSSLNKFNVILLLGSPRPGRGINLETPGAQGWFGSIFWLRWGPWARGCSLPK